MVTKTKKMAIHRRKRWNRPAEAEAEARTRKSKGKQSILLLQRKHRQLTFTKRSLNLWIEKNLYRHHLHKRNPWDPLFLQRLAIILRTIRDIRRCYSN
mmetsp:Transcript_49246/g.138470  ORF Transcript_49246/g.138470 Transcript_49246/m.138470 type:complete len:98 (+) Transcript_49246:83-376(+)